MIFKPREKRSWWHHLRQALWPSMSFGRVALYYKHRIARLPGTPYYIACGFATGMAVSFTPFVGFHLMLGGLVTWLLGGSLVAMALGAVLSGNPWTYPFIWIGCYKLGRFMLGHRAMRAATGELMHRQFTFSDLLHRPMELLLPMLLGCVPLVIIVWSATYYVASGIVTRSKEKRKARIQRRRQAAHHGKPPD
ncbi:MAG: DUF2062 domain-containing protein [Alphaproteobacteria bacterium]|nr:DUF2062 domain-containing protein [Alphaproteobacteria bacterium]MDE2335908.1 DUF2062 domain-containing protein [Alphaproteobacteria bacterium]